VSAGGVVATDFALAHPDVVSGLVWVGPGYMIIGRKTSSELLSLENGVVQVSHQQVDVDAVGLSALAYVLELRHRAAHASQTVPHEYLNRLGMSGNHLSNRHIGCDRLLLHIIPPHSLCVLKIDDRSTARSLYHIFHIKSILLY
jgi:pimeloyl-ACP methyl ester carboxylesterase